MFQKKTNVKSFNIVTSQNEAKTMIKYISWDRKCNFNGARCNSNQKWNNKTCSCECEKLLYVQQYYCCNPRMSI